MKDDSQRCGITINLEHAVALINNEVLDLIELQIAGIQQGEETSRCTDDDVLKETKSREGDQESVTEAG